MLTVFLFLFYRLRQIYKMSVAILININNMRVSILLNHHFDFHLVIIKRVSNHFDIIKVAKS